MTGPKEQNCYSFSADCPFHLNPGNGGIPNPGTTLGCENNANGDRLVPSGPTGPINADAAGLICPAANTPDGLTIKDPDRNTLVTGTTNVVTTAGMPPPLDQFTFTCVAGVLTVTHTALAGATPYIGVDAMDCVE